MANNRKSWNEYFCDVAAMVATRSTCPRLAVGAVLVRNKHIISTGYNGVPPGVPHCTDNGCVLVDNHCSLVIHAEINAIKHCEVDTRYSTLYLTHSPCIKCFEAIFEAGVKRVIYANAYNPPDYVSLLPISANRIPSVVQLGTN